MSSIPAIVGGAAKDAKPSVIVGGAEKKTYDAYVIVGGAAKLAYRSGIEWACADTVKMIEVNPMGSMESIGYGCNALRSAYMEVVGYRRVRYESDTVYTFKEPFIMHTGQTIKLDQDFSVGGNIYDSEWSAVGSVYFNGESDLKIIVVSPNESSKVYTFTQDTLISSIRVNAYAGLNVSGSTHASSACIMQVTVNADIGSFLLNNSGISN